MNKGSANRRAGDTAHKKGFTAHKDLPASPGATRGKSRPPGAVGPSIRPGPAADGATATSAKPAKRDKAAVE